jgi:hypothetical protein
VLVDVISANEDDGFHSRFSYSLCQGTKAIDVPEQFNVGNAQPTGSLSVSQAKARIKAKLAECFCDRDKAVVLGDVEYPRFASMDREQGRMGRCVAEAGHHLLSRSVDLIVELMLLSSVLL